MSQWVIFELDFEIVSISIVVETLRHNDLGVLTLITIFRIVGLLQIGDKIAIYDGHERQMHSQLWVLACKHGVLIKSILDDLLLRSHEGLHVVYVELCNFLRSFDQHV